MPQTECASRPPPADLPCTGHWRTVTPRPVGERRLQIPLCV